ncbi:MAG: hypothetical protein WD270_05165 [Acetobacterales bacterium]
MVPRLLRRYEVALYNKDVRERVNADRRHSFLDDSWADVRYIEIKAESEDDVYAKLRRRYPEDQGFVVESVRVDKF